MKKILKILVVIILIAVAVEGAFYVAYLIKWKDAIKTQWDNGNKVIMKYSLPKPFSPNENAYTWHNRIFEKKNSKKRPLAIVGCSFAEGSCLEDNQILGYKLSDLSNRTVYQRGVTGTGLSFVYYQIDNKLIPTDDKSPEYIIYVFIFDHLFRLYQHQVGFWSTEINLRYENKDDKIQEVKEFLPFYNMFYTAKYLQEDIAKRKGVFESQNYALFKPMLTSMIKIAKQNYPNSKIVFLEYPQSDEKWCVLSEDAKKFIKDEGYIYVNANELVGDQLGKREYKVKGEWLHPNEKAWDLLAPKLAKLLKL